MDISLLNLKLDSYIGSQNGFQAFSKLSDQLNELIEEKVFNISFKGIEQIDASFTIASIITLTRLFKRDKYFYLSGVSNRDVLINLDCVTTVYDIPFLVLDSPTSGKWIGKKLTPNNLELLKYIQIQPSVTASTIAKKFGLSVPNASIKLKKLSDQGYLIAQKQDAATGGHEYVFKPIQMVMLTNE